MHNEATALKPPFGLDVVSISGTQLKDPYCAPIINTINNHNNFNRKSMSLHNENKTLRTSDNAVVVPLCL